MLLNFSLTFFFILKMQQQLALFCPLPRLKSKNLRNSGLVLAKHCVEQDSELLILELIKGDRCDVK
jgi:hypothetical protein